MATVRLLNNPITAGISSWHPTDPGDSYANAWVENWNGDGHALVKFADLSEIPAAATIQQARLRWLMYDADDTQYEREGTGTLTIRANRITANWQRSSVTWNTKPTNTSVDAPSLSDTFNTPGGWTDWWDVTTHVAAIVAGTYSNYGWLMEMTNYGGGVAFDNYGYVTELEVTYVAPAVATTDSPSGNEDNPEEITDKVSGFDLEASFESEGNEPISQITAQIYDVEGNQAWEYEKTYNELTGNQQSVETDTTGFTLVGGATISRDTSRAWHGSASLKVTPAASSGSGARIAFAAPEIGQEYSGRTMVSGPFGTTLEMQLQAVDSGGNVLSAGSVQREILGNTSLTGCSQTEANSWTEFEVEDVTAVASTNEIQIEVTTTDSSAPVFYLDGNIINPDTEVAPWISQGQVTFPVPINTLEYGANYSWRVSAENSAGSSGWSPLTYFMCVLSAVTGLIATGNASAALIALAWDAHSGENLAGYKIYRAKTGETLAQHSIDLATTESYDDDAAETNITYDYKVAAVSSDGYEGPKSNLETQLVVFDGVWLGDQLINIKGAPQITKPRLASNRVALDDSIVNQDYGFGTREIVLELQYLSKTEKETFYAVLDPTVALSYRDFLGEVFRGRISGPVNERPYFVPNLMAGVLTVRLIEVTPVD